MTIIPAAGASRRLGRPKQLLDPGGGGGSLLCRAARRAVNAGVGPVTVVLGHEAARCADSLAGIDCQHITIADWAEGMAAAVRAGVAAAASCDAVLLTLVDQWALTADDLSQVALVWRQSGLPMAAAEYAGGTLGPPAVFGREMFDALAKLHGDAGARLLLRGPGALVASVAMPHAEHDLDE